MTSAQRIPVTPDPESDEVLCRMLKLILRHPSCLHVHLFEFQTSQKGIMSFVDSKWKGSIDRSRKQDKIYDLPDGKRNIEKALELVKSLEKEELPLFREYDAGNYYNPHNLCITVKWKDFTLIELFVNIKKDSRTLVIGYYPNSTEFSDERFWDKEGLSHLSKPFINLFQQFKAMFNSIVPDKYIILPEISDRKERALILSELRKAPHNPDNYKKIDEYF
ncbi:hypothetical protein LCGC14_1074490 [marine sediment metagenome]|uniref:Uncharacterized protein n=1 Tax=marine sediment metagenome TaxID=412755 RepID=A0A0F9Q068_9ZZZZ